MTDLKKYIANYKRKFWTSIVIVALSFCVLLTLTLLFGTNNILNYIEEKASKVESRELEFGIDEESGYHFVKNDDDTKPIKILQISDIHLSAGVLTMTRDKKVVDSVIQIVDVTKPDMIVITGDMIYPSIMALTFNNYNSSRAIGKLFESFEIPWAFVYGNHDAESYATQTKTQLSNYFEGLEYCLFQRGPDNISGQGNYVVKLLSETGELESALVMMDSNAYVGLIEYDIVHDDQVAWYEQEISKLKNSQGDIVPTHLFLHIPLYEYRLAWEGYQNGDADVIYHYGVKDNRRIASANDDRGKLFDKMLELGSTKTVFVGHDHTHNFSITYKGIRLTYGMSMDYTAYVYTYFINEHRGGTLLLVSTQGENFEIFRVPQTNNFLPVVE